MSRGHPAFDQKKAGISAVCSVREGAGAAFSYQALSTVGSIRADMSDVAMREKKKPARHDPAGISTHMAALALRLRFGRSSLRTVH